MDECVRLMIGLSCRWCWLCRMSGVAQVADGEVVKRSYVPVVTESPRRW